MALKSITLVAGLCLLFVAACASLSEETCRAGDWEQIGFQDGTQGQGPDHIFRHARACNGYGITPNKTRWDAGRKEGLKLYCTPRVAYEEGADGDRLRPVCPIEDRPPLLAQNERGLTWYRLGRDIDDAERRISQINSALRNLANDDPARATLTGERLLLRLDISGLRAQQRRYRFRG